LGAGHPLAVALFTLAGGVHALEGAADRRQADAVALGGGIAAVGHGGVGCGGAAAHGDCEE